MQAVNMVESVLMNGSLRPLFSLVMAKVIHFQTSLNSFLKLFFGMVFESGGPILVRFKSSTNTLHTLLY